MITKSREVVAARHRSWLTEALPLIVLGAGLLVVAIVVTTSEQQSTFAGLRRLLSDSYLPQAVGTQPSFAPFPPIEPFSPDLPHRSWWLTMVFEITYLTATMAIGSRLVTAIRGDDEWPTPVRWLAGFLPGYLMTLAPLQLLFSAVPLATASWIGLAAVPAGAVALHWRSVIAGVRNPRLPRRDGTTVAASIALVMVVVAAIHRLQQGVFHLTQDSIFSFLYVAQWHIQRAPGTEYLLHWKTQTDEWLYNAPLMFSHGSDGDLWFPFYLTQSISVAAFLCLVYGIVHRVARRRKVLAGSLAAAAVFGSTLAIYPWLYVTIVGGGQPVIALAHPGRHIGIIAPWAALLIMQNPRKAPVWALGLATLGLGFVTLNDILYVGLAITAGLIWHALRGRPSLLQTPTARIGIHATLVLALALPIVAYSSTQDAPSTSSVPTLILAAACLAALSGAALITWGTAKADHQISGASVRWLAWLGAWILTATIGILFSDNLGATKTGQSAHDFLAPLLAGFDGQPVNRGDLTDGVFAGLSFFTFSPGACDSNTSCGGIPNFFMGYGVLFSLALAAWVAYGRLKPEAERTNQRRVAMLIGLAALPPVMILVFFMGAETLQAGALTRLLEWPYYTLLVLGVLAFCEMRRQWVAIAGASFLAIWTIVPLLSFEWPVQMTRNAEFYLQKFGVL
jgi:hypothetical protein